MDIREVRLRVFEAVVRANMAATGDQLEAWSNWIMNGTPSADQKTAQRTEEEERKRFEEWALSNRQDIGRVPPLRMTYSNSSTLSFWVGWKAAVGL